MLAVEGPAAVRPVGSVEKPPAVLAPGHDDRRELLAGPDRIDVGRADPGPWHARGVSDRAERYLDQPVGGCLRVESFFPQSLLKVGVAEKIDASVRDRARVEHLLCHSHEPESSCLPTARLPSRCEALFTPSRSLIAAGVLAIPRELGNGERDSRFPCSSWIAGRGLPTDCDSTYNLGEYLPVSTMYLLPGRSCRMAWRYTRMVRMLAGRRVCTRRSIRRRPRAFLSSPISSTAFHGSGQARCDGESNGRKAASGVLAASSRGGEGAAPGDEPRFSLITREPLSCCAARWEARKRRPAPC